MWSGRLNLFFRLGCGKAGFISVGLQVLLGMGCLLIPGQERLPYPRCEWEDLAQFNG